MRDPKDSNVVQRPRLGDRRPDADSALPRDASAAPPDPQMARRSEGDNNYQQLIDTAHQGVWTIDVEGRTTYVNGRMAELLGYTPDEMMGRVHTDFMWEEDRSQGDEQLEQRRQGTRAVWDQRYRRKDGSELWTVASCNSLVDDDGQVAGALGMFTDISDRKRWEKELQNSQQLMSVALRSAKAGAWSWDARTNQMIWSAEQYALFGRDPGGPVTFADWQAAIHPEDRDRMLRFAEGLRASPQDCRTEFRILTAAGERWIMAVGRSERDSCGDAVRYAGINLDVTNQKLAETRDRESEAKYQALADSTPDGFAAFDQNLRYIYWNKAAEVRTGRTADQVLGRTRVEVWGDTEAVRLTNAKLRECMETARPISLDLPTLVPDRTEWIHARLVPMPDGVATFLRDITGQRTAEQELRALYAQVQDQKNRLSMVLHNINEEVWFHDADGRVILANPAAHSAFGAVEDQEIANSPASLKVCRADGTPRPDHETPIAPARAGQPIRDLEEIVKLPVSGDDRTRRVTSVPVHGSNGAVLGVVSVVRDISDDKRIEAMLRASEQRFRAAIDAVQGVLWTNSADGEMHGEQPGWAALTGQTFDEYQGFGWSKAVHPDDAQPTIDAWLIAVRERRTFMFEHRVRRYDGVWRRFTIRAVPILDAAGGIQEWVGVHTDVTDQRESDLALRASEARYRAIQDTSIDGFMVLESVRNIDGQIVDFRWLHANRAAERILGKPRAWFYGRRLLEEMPANRDEGLFDAYVKVVETGEPWTHEFAYPHEGVNAFLRLIAAKTADGFAVSFADLSDRRRVEQLVQERERQFLSLANAMPQLVWTASPTGGHTFYNRGWYAYTGLTVDESAQPDAWDRVIHPEEIERRAARWAHSLGTGELYEAQFRLRRHDGAYRWFLARAVADRDDKGRIQQWFGTCTDIDGTKRTEESLRRTEAALREADMRKDVFLATLSHELRNPLAPIRNAASLLEKSSLHPEAVERSRLIIGRQVRHMASLLDDLLDVSRITRGVFVLKKEYVNLQGILAEALETARPLIDAKRHSLVLDWPPESIEVEADPVRLVQVITNLLTNAAKYTDPDGRIHFSARIDQGLLVIAVSDSGIGLAPEMLPKVFDMFSQVSPNQGRTEGGLGIGLSLVKGLVELHGGRIEARSAGLERGSEFVIFLPCVHAESGTHRRLSFASQASEVTPARRVLIADDNRDGAESMGMLLEISGHQTYLAHTGPEAVTLAKQHRPEVVILDIGMPGLSGYEVAKLLRSEAWGARLTLIAMTGWGQEDDKRKAQEAGFDHHVTKPVDTDALEKLIHGTDDA